jgi:hypothetical protein
VSTVRFAILRRLPEPIVVSVFRKAVGTPAGGRRSPAAFRFVLRPRRRHVRGVQRRRHHLPLNTRSAVKSQVHPRCRSGGSRVRATARSASMCTSVDLSGGARHVRVAERVSVGFAFVANRLGIRESDQTWDDRRRSPSPHVLHERAGFTFSPVRRSIRRASSGSGCLPQRSSRNETTLLGAPRESTAELDEIARDCQRGDAAAKISRLDQFPRASPPYRPRRGWLPNCWVREAKRSVERSRLGLVRKSRSSHGPTATSCASSPGPDCERDSRGSRD